MGKRRNKRRKLRRQKEKANQNKPKYRKPKVSKIKTPQTSHSATGSFANLACSASILLDKTNLNVIIELGNKLDTGRLSSLVFLAYGKWNSRTKNRLKSILEANGIGWTYNHCVFPITNEREKSFLFRILIKWNINLLLENNKERIAYLADPNTKWVKDVAIFNWAPTTKYSIEEKLSRLNAWIKKYNPYVYALIEKKDHHIITTALDREAVAYDNYVSGRFE